MKLRTLENQTRVFLNPHEFDTLVDCAETRRGKQIIQLLGRSSPRVGVFTDDGAGPRPTFRDLRQSDHPGVDLWFLRIYGKDTKDRDTDGKVRDIWIPDDVKEDLDRWQDNEGRSMDDPIFYACKRTLQREVKRAAENAAERTGNPDFKHVSAHDLRAFFATNMAIRHGVSEQVVMELGGWSDAETFRSCYLNAQFDDVIQSKLAAAGVIDEDPVSGSAAQFEQIQRQIEQLRKTIEQIEISPTASSASQPTAETTLGEFL